MPDSTLAASTDGRVSLTSTSSWAGAEGSATTAGNGHSYTSTNSTIGVYARTITSGGRGGGTTYYCTRSFFAFDCSGESGTVDSATLKLYLDNYGTNGPPSAVVVVGADALDGDVNDHGNIFSSGTTRHNAYSSSSIVTTTAQYISFSLNFDGITALNSAIGSGTFTCALVSDIFDHLGTTPSSTYARTQVYYTEDTSGSKDPLLEIDYAAIVRNSILFGTNF